MAADARVDDFAVARDPAFTGVALPVRPTRGLLGPAPAPDDLRVIVSVGASLLDRRYGLAARRPRELVEMPFLADDRPDPERSHGDLLLTVQAEHRTRWRSRCARLMRRTRRALVLRGVLDGDNLRVRPTATASGSGRNLTRGPAPGGHLGEGLVA